MYIYIYTGICIYVYMYVCTHMPLGLATHICIYTYTHIYVWGDRNSSSAWIVHVTWQFADQRHRFVVAFGYEFLEGNHSSFVTKSMGLEQAVGAVLRLMGLCA